MATGLSLKVRSLLWRRSSGSSLLRIVAVIGLSWPGLLVAEPFDSFYVSHGGGAISGYRVDPVTGRPVPVPGSPFASGSRTVSVALHPSRRFLYAVNPTSLSVLAVDPARAPWARRRRWPPRGRPCPPRWPSTLPGASPT